MWQCDSPYLYFLALSLDMVSLKKKKKKYYPSNLELSLLSFISV